MIPNIENSLLRPAMMWLACLTLLLMLGFSASVAASVSVPANASLGGVPNKDPGTDLWRQVRQQDIPGQMRTQVDSIDSGVLIRAGGEEWRQFRMQQLIPWGGRLLVGFLIVVVLFRLVRGRINLVEGRSGKKIMRFTLNQRVAHWTTAILFVTLAITGILLLFGRVVIIPWLGAEAFSYIAVTAKALHDYLGPAFAISLLFLALLFIRGNILHPKEDLDWFIHAGGLLTDKHVKAGRYNAGEKSWYWFAVLVGLVVVASGLVLDFPIFNQSRETMELFHIIHSIAAVLIITASMGHIYMGTVGVEATFEIMKTGYCDSNWAREHHYYWHERKVAAGEVLDEADVPKAAKSDSVSRGSAAEAG